MPPSLYTFYVWHAIKDFLLFFFARLVVIKMEEEERKLLASIQEAERQCEATDAEVKELEMKSKSFEKLEERLVLKNDFK